MMWSASALGRRSVMVVGADNFITSEITSAAHHQTTATPPAAVLQQHGTVVTCRCLQSTDTRSKQVSKQVDMINV